MMRVPLSALFVVMLFTACAVNPFSQKVVREEFDRSFDKYNQLVRWQGLDGAVIFSSAPNVEAFRSRADAARKVKMVDYQIVQVSYDEKAREASAVVIFSYYHPTDGLLKNVTDSQKWAYIAEGNGKSWRVTSPPPDFR